VENILNLELSIDEVVDKIIEPKELFPKFERFEIEIGFCSAFFLSKYANLNKNVGLLGIEKKRKYYKRGVHILERNLKQNNVKVVCYDAIAIIKELIPFESVDAFHIYFPDPWPKKKHLQRRILKMENLLIMANRLKKGGKIFMATDHPEYAKAISEEIMFCDDFLKIKSFDESKRTIKTKWETKQIERGWKINYFLMEKE